MPEFLAKALTINRLTPMAVGMLGWLLLPGQASAELCPAPAYVSSASPVISDANAPIIAEADRLLDEGGVVSLIGNTTLSYQGREIAAEDAQYNPETGEVVIDGQLEFRGPGISLDSRNASFDLDGNAFRTGPSNYEIGVDGQRASGSAEGMERLGNGDFVLDGATYSSCPPGDESWQISARRIHLYPDEGIGTARNIVLRFKGVPLFAVPVFSFPIGPARKTGFLAPVVARGERTGLEIEVPWYWNIRPNVDATLTPRLMSQRGAQLKSEFRYLNRQGLWTLDSEYLRDTALDGERRSFVQLYQLGEFDRHWSSYINASHVSDSDYFTDLGDSLQLASVTHLERLAEILYSNGTVEGVARLQDFQTVDPDIKNDDQPYRRLPQLALEASTPEPRYGIYALMESEYVYFDRTASTTGSRIDVQPGFRLPLSGDAWFLTPTLKHRFTYYELNPQEPDELTSRSRNLSIFSLDAGLFFDRRLDAGGSVQTLEPRLYYLRVPFERQADLPNFDSSAFDFNIAQLFRENRFTGADRIADADQLSMALTSRFINGADGRELLRGSVGQILYFDDRRVQLAENDESEEELIDNSDVSDLVGEISAEITDNWFAKGGIQWNTEQSSVVRSSLLLSYRPAADRIINLAHRNVNTGLDADTEQVDISAIWPVYDNWRLAGRWNYAFGDNRTSIETLFGVEYESCCWALRFAARRYIAEDGDDHDTSVYLQLVLKGLAPVGQNYGGLLESTILGYRDDYE